MSTSDRRRVRRLLLAGATACAALTRVVPAGAQSQNEAAARALFNEGRQAIKAGRIEEGCGKFEAARKLFISPGVLLNLADCHERGHRTASAWTEFGDAAEAAANAGRTKDEAEARRRQASLEDRLSRLAIRVDSPTSDEVVNRDGAPLDRSAWESPIPVDPGTHVVTADAPGRRSWTAAVSVDESGKTVVVQIPRLEKLDQTGRPAASPPPAGTGGAQPNPPVTASVGEGAAQPSSPGSGQRVAGWVMGGVGIAAMATAGALGLAAKSQFGAAEGETGPARVSDAGNAGKLADVATVVLVGGAVVTAAGIVVWATVPGGRIAVGTNGQALFVSGRFE